MMMAARIVPIVLVMRIVPVMTRSIVKVMMMVMRSDVPIMMMLRSRLSACHQCEKNSDCCEHFKHYA
jgi:hypothetical protein